MNSLGNLLLFFVVLFFVLDVVIFKIDVDTLFVIFSTAALLVLFSQIGNHVFSV
jgi:hypothetical protein